MSSLQPLDTATPSGRRHLPCYVVNLHSAAARRTKMQEMLSALGVEPIIFDAVDGRQMSDAERERHIDRSRMLAGEVLSPGEIGCALSHIAVYRDIIEHGHTAAVILEDDVHVADDFLDLLDPDSVSCLSRALSVDAPEMLQLTKVSRGYRLTSHRIGPHRLICRPASGVWLTSGYVINLVGARSLVDHLYPVWTVADHWGLFQEKGFVSLKVLSPPAVWESDLAVSSSLSTFRVPDEPQKKTLTQRLRRIAYDIGRPFLTRSL